MGLIDALKSRLAPAAPDAQRWVVLDVESSGLDTRRDRLLAIAAIAVRVEGPRAEIDLGDSFEVLLRQPEATAAAPDKANILLHGIGVGAQRAGEPPALALASFARYVGRSPLLAFHAAFDQQMINRALQAAQAPRLANPWLDLAPLAAVLHPQVRAQALDEWLAHFGIGCFARHQAAADTLATCELLLRLWPALCAQLPVPRFAAVARLAAQQRWLNPQ